jgi:hypothetical protein
MISADRISSRGTKLLFPCSLSRGGSFLSTLNPILSAIFATLLPIFPIPAIPRVKCSGFTFLEERILNKAAKTYSVTASALQPFASANLIPIEER